MEAITSVVNKYEPEHAELNAQLAEINGKTNAITLEINALSTTRSNLRVYLHNNGSRTTTPPMDTAVAKLRWTLINDAIKELEGQRDALEVEAEGLKKKMEESSRCFLVELSAAVANMVSPVNTLEFCRMYSDVVLQGRRTKSPEASETPAETTPASLPEDAHTARVLSFLMQNSN